MKAGEDRKCSHLGGLSCEFSSCSLTLTIVLASSLECRLQLWLGSLMNFVCRVVTAEGDVDSLLKEGRWGRNEIKENIFFSAGALFDRWREDYISVMQCLAMRPDHCWIGIHEDLKKWWRPREETKGWEWTKRNIVLVVVMRNAACVASLSNLLRRSVYQHSTNSAILGKAKVNHLEKARYVQHICMVSMPSLFQSVKISGLPETKMFLTHLQIPPTNRCIPCWWRSTTPDTVSRTIAH